MSSDTPEAPRAVVEAKPAATVVILREAPAGAEVLLVQRNARLAFHGGAWVFPGGRIDPDDYPPSGDVIAAARRAAVREAREEAGLTVDEAGLLLFARWVTPELLPKRFDTWFFAARALDDVVQIDGGEIHGHRWILPAEALAEHQRGAIELPPPTWVTVQWMAGCATVADAERGLRRHPIEEFVPRLHVGAAGPCSVYAGDAAYESGDLEAPGPRHRLWMVDGGWRYERSGIESDERTHR